MSWLSNEPTNDGLLLFATNYWTSILMHGWIWIFVTRLFGDLFRLFQSCLRNYHINGARVRVTGIVEILTQNINTSSQSCRHFSSDTFLSEFFCLPSVLRVVNCACAHKRPDVTMVSCREMFCEIICHIFESWCPYYSVRVKIYLINQPKILAVHRSRSLLFDCAVANFARRVIVYKGRGWALFPTYLFQGES